MDLREITGMPLEHQTVDEVFGWSACCTENCSPVWLGNRNISLQYVLRTTLVSPCRKRYVYASNALMIADQHCVE